MTLRSAFLVATLVLSACATGTPSVPAAGFEGNSFTDPTRGIRATLPVGWVFVAPERFAAIQKSGADVLAERNPGLALSAIESAKRTQILFVMANAFTPGAGRESITLLVEVLPTSFLGMTTETYSLALRNNLRNIGFSAYGGDGPASISISGALFGVVHVISELGSGTGRNYQSYYVRLIGKEVRTFIATHDRQDREDALLEIIQSLDVEE